VGVSTHRRASAPPSANALADEQLAITWHFASLLLARPDAKLLRRLEPVHRATHTLPDQVGGPLRSTVVHLERAPLTQLEEEYAEAVAVALRLSGFPGEEASADHLCAVLERAATTGSSTGRTLLLEHHTGLETVHASLLGAESGWSGAVGAVLATLSALEAPSAPA
jgi:nitrate reductase molybdenum cofactor assembly chaperone NarJ/NarW